MDLAFRRRNQLTTAVSGIIPRPPALSAASCTRILLALALVALLASAPARADQPGHPLDPLTAAEIETAMAVLRQSGKIDASFRFPAVSLQEPPKAQVLAWKPGSPIPRQALIVAFNPAANKTYEAVVDVAAGRLVSWKEMAGIQPGVLISEFETPADIVRAHPDFIAAMRRRGITDLTTVQIDTWAPGNNPMSSEPGGRRLLRLLVYLRGPGIANPYARPVEGVTVLFDANKMEVVEVIDTEVVPLPPETAELDEASNQPLRPAPKPLILSQPQGTTFTLDGHQVTYQNWRFRWSMHPREGLVIYQVEYRDQGTWRPVLYRGSLAEMVVPYGDPSPHWIWRNAFDLGEYGVGRLADTMTAGLDVPANAVFADATFADDEGKPYTMPRVVAFFEKDAGLLWKHYDFDSDSSQTRRARDLYVFFVATVGNYDYAFNWIFSQDGSITVRADLTGILLAKGVDLARQPARAHEAMPATLVAPYVAAPNHQHFFAFRLDLDVDGVQNRVAEMNSVALPKGPQNPYGNVFVAEETVLATEGQARRDMNLASARMWMVQSSTRTNRLGQPTSFALHPGENCKPFADPSTLVRRRAGFVDHHLWVTRQDDGEPYPAGTYPNQSGGGAGLPEYAGDDEPIKDTDVVLWYVMGVNHIPRPEDWPVMPVHQIGFKLAPFSFFDRNPAMDVPVALPPEK
jgi:primary-amine oxidase